MDRIESQLQGQAAVIRINAATATGLDVVRRYGIRATPTTLVLNVQGHEVYAQTGVPNAAAVAQAVSSAR